jgi:hypothetical protein
VTLGYSGSRTRLRSAQAAAAPFVTPEVVSLGDSDGNRTMRYGGTIDVLPVDGLRAGVGFWHEAIAGEVDEVSGTSMLGRVTAVLSPGLTLSAEGGAARFGGPRREPGPPNATGRSWGTIQAGARLRARPTSGGASIDLRVERAPLGFNPELVQNQATRTETRVVVDAPLGLFRVRGAGRAGRIEALGEPANGRLSIEGGVLLPLGGRVLPSVVYRVSGFDRPSSAGYFAPRSARTVEIGTYLEAGDDGPVSLAADLGAGLQRVAEHGAAAGSWSRVWRAWAQGSVALGPSRSWSIELEAYDSPFALEGASAGGNWRFLSVSSGIRWCLR